MIGKDLVLEYLRFYLSTPMRKHYVVTLNKETREVLQGILNPYASAANIEFMSLQRAMVGWRDKSANVAFGCTHLFSDTDTETLFWEHLRYRTPHPQAAVFVRHARLSEPLHLLLRS